MLKNPRDSIIALPNQNLRLISKKVGYINDDTKKLISKMEQATLDWEDNRKHEVGVALAAPQIDAHLKVVIIREDFEDKENRNFTVLINPEIIKYEGKLLEDYEGCLSIKDIYGKVPRYEKVRVKAKNIEGKEFRFTAQGFMARVVQHEIDHTKGKLFIDHIKDKKDAFFKLDSDGKLERLDYDSEISNSDILW